jgi:Asp-tRNA(Asn)/Glu-tRNA(Gln) amidotransferase A subunit family amidase
MPTDGVSILAPSFDRLGLIAATPQDLAFAWTAFGGTIGEPPGRVVTLAADQLGRVEPERLEAVRQVSGGAVELAAPSLPKFGPPRATVITAEAAARHHGETAAARAQLEAGAALTREEVDGARAELERLGQELREAVGDGVLVTPTLPSDPPRWDEVEDTDAQLRATGRLTRLCGPVNSARLVAVSHGPVQLIARDIPTALGAALRLP